jgi:hypothetical protein
MSLIIHVHMVCLMFHLLCDQRTEVQNVYFKQYANTRSNYDLSNVD